MNIHLSHVRQLKIPDLPPGAAGETVIEVDDGTTVEDLLTSLGLKPEHLKLIKPYINDAPVPRSRQLESGDSLFLFLAAGGG